MKRQRYNFDDIWSLFVEACGDRCCVCLKEMPAYRLQRGHIRRQADLGPASLANLIPVCPACNGKHSLTDTPDHRPLDWQSRFLKALARHWNLSIRKKAGAPLHEAGAGVASLPQPQDAEATKVITMDEIEFVVDSEVLTSLRTGVPLPATEKEITAAVREAIREGKRHGVPLTLPSTKVQSEMHRLAAFWQPKAFLAAVDEFLRQECWFEMRGDFPSRLMPHHEWERFCENFDLFLADHKARITREAAAERKRLAAEAEAQRKWEQDPENIRRQKEATAAMLAEARRREANRRLAPLHDAFKVAVDEVGDFSDDPVTWSRYTAIRDLLRQMMQELMEGKGWGDEDLKKHRDRFWILLSQFRKGVTGREES
jgi:hypothetical protein